jgi:hypothetical protein
MALIKKRYPKFLGYATLIVFVLGGWSYINWWRLSTNSIFPKKASTFNRRADIVTENGLVPQQGSEGQTLVQEVADDTKSSQEIAERKKSNLVANAIMFSEHKDDKLQQLANSLIAGPEDDQIEAIRLLSKIGTPEQKTMIELYAANSKCDISIRLAALENIDWEKNAEALSKIIQDQTGVAEATLYMASAKELSEETRATLNEAAYFTFLNTTNPSTQLAILDYFLEQQDSLFDELYSRLSLNLYSPEEKEDVARLLKKRMEGP